MGASPRMLTVKKLELIFHEITDRFIRENFARLEDFINRKSPLSDFKFFEIDIPEISGNLPVKHGLPFVPLDVVMLSATGNQNFYFLNQFFDAENIYISTSGPVRLRFLLGKFTDPGYEKGPVDYLFTPPT